MGNQVELEWNCHDRGYAVDCVWQVSQSSPYLNAVIGHCVSKCESLREGCYDYRRLSAVAIVLAMYATSTPIHPSRLC